MSRFTLTTESGLLISCAFAPTFGTERRGFPSKIRHVTYPNGSIQVEMPDGRTPSFSSLDLAKEYVARSTGEPVRLLSNVVTL